MFYEEMQATVDRAAELLPEPPSAGNPEGYARWEALTLDTGRQLARVLDADIGLLKTLMGDESWTPLAYRQRRRLLLRVALFAACQIARREHAEPGLPFHHSFGSGGIARAAADSLGRPLSLSRPAWLEAK